MVVWDPTRYLQFADVRARPFLDLIAQIPTNPLSVIDLGCGPGHLTKHLRARWPSAEILGIGLDPAPAADGPAFREELAHLANGVAERLRKSGSRARTITIKLRYTNFRTITRQTSRPEPTGDAEEILAAASMLLDKVVEDGDTFRLLGIQASKLSDTQPEDETLPLFPSSK